MAARTKTGALRTLALTMAAGPGTGRLRRGTEGRPAARGTCPRQRRLRSVRGAFRRVGGAERLGARGGLGHLDGRPAGIREGAGDLRNRTQGPEKRAASRPGRACRAAHPVRGRHRVAELVAAANGRRRGAHRLPDRKDPGHRLGRGRQGHRQGGPGGTLCHRAGDADRVQVGDHAPGNRDCSLQDLQAAAHGRSGGLRHRLDPRHAGVRECGSRPWC